MKASMLTPVKPSSIKFLYKTFFLLYCILFASLVNASIGSDWIVSEVNSNGSINSQISVNHDFAATSETLITLNIVGESDRVEVSNALHYLSTDLSNDTINICLTLLSQFEVGIVDSLLIAKLESRVNSDGGAAPFATYQSNLLDTAFTLKTLAKIQPQSPYISGLVEYLILAQQADGGFKLDLDEQTSVYVSSIVSLSLQVIKNEYEIQNELDALTQYLLSQRNLIDPPASNYETWQSNWEASLALLAILKEVPDRSSYQVAIDKLLADQFINGSWDDDVYTTALALRVQAIIDGTVFIPPQNPSSIIGVVVDESNNQIIPAVNITLSTDPISETQSSITGSFSFRDLNSGTYQLNLSAIGYQDLSIDINVLDNQVLDIGQAKLFKTVTVALLQGVISDVNTLAPLEGAHITIQEVVTGNTIDLLSNIRGEFAQALSPVEMSVEIILTGYEPVLTTLSLIAGQTFNLSVSLAPTGSPPATLTHLIGQVIDSQTSQLIESADVVITNGLSTITNQTGNFEFINLVPEQIELTISKDGYYPLVANVNLIAGTINLGQVRLNKIIQATTITLSGVITDEVSQSPIEGASVLNSSTGIIVTTDASGFYLIEGIRDLDFDLTTTKSGYFTKTTQINVSGFGEVRHDFDLREILPSELQILSLETSSLEYNSNQEVEIDVTLKNTSSSQIGTRLFIKIINEQGEIVENEPVIHVPIGGSISDAIEMVPANDQLAIEVPWYTRSYSAGIYTIVISANQPNTNTNFDEKSLTITILPTNSVGGLVEFDPPVMQFDPNRLVNIKATIANTGNLPTGDFDITAKVYLTAKAENPPDEQLISTVIPNQFQDKIIYGMEERSDGNILMAAETSILMLDPSTNIITEFAPGFSRIRDVSISTTGLVYVADESTRKITELNTDGSVNQVFDLGIVPSSRIEVVLGKVVFTTGNGIFELDPTTSVIRNIAEFGLSNPSGIVVANNGDIYVTDQSRGFIYLFNGSELSLFTTGLDQPQSLTFDTDGTLLVTEWRGARLVRVDMSGNITSVATDIPFPYDVKVTAAGTYLVSYRNGIYEVYADGSKTQRSNNNLSNPTLIAFDDSGTSYIYNRGTRKISKEYNDGTIEVLNATFNFAKDMIIDQNQDLIVMDTNLISKFNELSDTFDQILSPDDFFKNIAKGINPSELGIIDGDKVKIVNYASNTTLADVYLPSRNLVSLQVENQELFALNNSGNYSVIANDYSLSHGVHTFSNPSAFYIDGSGNKYIAEKSTKKVFKIDTLNNVTEYMVLSNTAYAMVVLADGSIVYSNASTKLYINNGTSESEYADLVNRQSTNVSMVLDDFGNLWVSAAAYRRGMSRVDIATGQVESITLQLNATNVNYHYGLASDNNGGIYVGGFGAIYHYDGTTTTEISLPSEIGRFNINRMALVNDKLWIHDDSNKILYQIDLAGNIIKKSAIEGALNSLLINTSENIVTTDFHVLSYDTTFSQLPEILLTGFYSKVTEYDASTLLFEERVHNRLYKIVKFDRNLSQLTGVSTTENPNDFAVSGLLIRAVKDSNLIFDFDINGNLIDSYMGIASPRGIAINETGDAFVISTYGIVKLRNDGYGDFVAVNSDPLYMIAIDGKLIAPRTSSQIYIYDQLTGEKTTLNLSIPFRSLKAIDIDSNGDYILSSTLGIIKVQPDGTSSKLISALHHVTDIESKSDGTLLIATSQNDLSSIFELSTVTGAINNLPYQLNLPVGLVAFSLLNDDMFFLYDSRSYPIQYFDESTGIIKNYPSVFGGQTILKNFITINNRTLYGTEQLDSRSRMFKLEIIDNSDTGVQIGTEVYSQTITHTSLLTNSSPIDLDFGSTLLPVSGSYRVELSANNPDLVMLLSNTLVTKALASGTISLNKLELFPGDSFIEANLALKSIDAQTVVETKPEQLLRMSNSVTFYRKMQGDVSGDILGLRGGKIYKISKLTGNSEIIFSQEFILDVEANDNGEIHILASHGRIFHISSSGNIIKTIESPELMSSGNFYSFSFDKVGNIYSYNSSNNFAYKYTSDTGWELLFKWAGTGRLLSVGESGYIYMIGGNYRNAEIYKVTPDGLSSELVVDGFTIEGEGGDSFDLMCYDNVLIAPSSYNGLPSVAGEEHALIQIDPKERIPRIIFEAYALGYPFLDADSIHYDKFNNRILLSTDQGNQGILAFPAYCASMTVETHIITRSDVNIELNPDTSAPQSIIDNADGTKEFIWKFEDVGIDATNLPLSAHFTNLVEGETRPVFAQAYLQFKNTLVPDQDLKVPLEIPTVHASSAKELALALDNNQYPSDTDVNIDDTVINNSGVSFTGVVSQHIETELGVFVDSLSDVFVNDLAAGAQITLPALWNTAYYFAGNYKVVSQLLDTNGVEQDAQEQAFTILPDQINGSIASLTIVANKAVYNTIDDVVLSTNVANLSSNSSLSNTQAQVLLSQPDNTIVFQNLSAVNNLLPNDSQSWQHSTHFDKVPIGTYLATLNLLDENGVIIASSVTSLEVVRDAQQVMSGNVTVLLTQVDTFTDNTCTYNLQNNDNQAINSIEVHQLLVDLVRQITIQEDIVTINLAANESWTNDQFIETFNLATNAYACILRTVISGVEQTQGNAVFNVIGFNHLTGLIWDDNNANGTQDGAESGIENAQLRLLDNNSNEIEVIATSADGSYEFTPVADGQYSIEVLQTGVLIGYINTTSNNPTTLNLAGNNSINNFGFQSHNSTISGFVYSDANGNGIQEATESLIPAISISLNDEGGQQLLSVNTDTFGAFEFDQLLATTYQIEVTDSQNILVDATLTTANQPYQILLSANQVDTNPVFGYQYHDSTITGKVFNDLNGNGVQDGGEAPIGNITVALSSSGVTQNGITDSNGNYVFNQLIADNYQVTVTDDNNQLNGYQLTTSNQPYSVALINHQTHSSGNFGYQAHLSSATGRVFKDDNANGIQDNAETIYANVSLELTGLNTTVQTMTNANGDYNFDQLAAGNYTITITDTNNVLIHTQLTTANIPYSLTLATMATDTTGVFGYQLQNSSALGVIYIDTNGNGIQEAGEIGLQGVSLDIVDTNNSIIASTTSQNAGEYLFTQLSAGDYQIIVTDTNGILSNALLTTANMPFSLNLSENDSQVGIAFGYQFTNSGISGLVFNDINGNGLNDNGELGLQNVTVELTKDGNIVQVLTTTNTGTYNFEALGLGQYVLTVTDTNTVLDLSDITTANQPYTIDLAENQQDTNGVFGYQYHRSEIVIEIFDDSNGNGVKDTAETGIDQVTARLMRDTVIIPSSPSDSNGQIRIENLVAGDYLVDIDDSNNILGDYNLTTANLPITLNLGDNQSDTSSLIGYQLADSSLTGLIYNDINGDAIQQTGENGLANVSLELNGIEQTTDAQGIFSYSGLVAGHYEIVITDNNQILTNAQLTSANLPYSIDILANQNITDAVFAYQFSQSNITGNVFDDLNADGLQQQNENGLAEVTIDLLQNAGVVQSTQTNASGVYNFNNLTAGDYTIIVTDNNAILSQGELTTNNQPYQVQLGDNQQHNEGNFGYSFINNRIYGHVYNDANRNGLFESEEMPMAQVELSLYKVTTTKSNVLEIRVVTDNQGDYQFPQLTTGQYYVHVTIPNGYQISPQNNDSYFDALTGNTEVINVTPQLQIDKSLGLNPLAIIPIPIIRIWQLYLLIISFLLLGYKIIYVQKTQRTTNEKEFKNEI